MNYIKALQARNSELNVEVDTLHAELDSLKAYLVSAKFMVDSTVQTGDVLRRIESAQANALNAAFDARTRRHMQEEEVTA